MKQLCVCRRIIEMNNNRRERERSVRESEIIEAAVKVFGQKGFENASVDEIALEAQFTKRTLYLYFENKEELFFAAALAGFQKLYAYLKESSEKGATGFERLRNGSKAYDQFYRDFPGTLRLIGETGQVKKSASEGSLRLKELMNIDTQLFEWAASAVSAAKADGSVRKDLDERKLTFSIIFLMTGFFNQLAVTGETFTSFFNLDLEEFSAYSMDLILDSLKAK